MGIQISPPNEHFDYYYGLIDFEFFARKNVGEDAVAWMKANVHPLDALPLATGHCSYSWRRSAKSIASH